MLFCKLENDQKTYDYLKQYLDFLYENKSLNTKSILFLDNMIQHQELHMHLYTKMIDPNEDSERKHKEVEEWIKTNAKNFRQYLSSIKLFACIANLKGYEKGDDLSIENFNSLCDSINGLKDILIDHIF